MTDRVCPACVASLFPLRGADGGLGNVRKISAASLYVGSLTLASILVHTGRNPRVRNGYRNGARAIILTAITGSGMAQAPGG
jgi:hypothetical protein